MVTQQVSSSPKKKKKEQQQLSSLVAQQLRSFSRKETTAQHLTRTWDGYCRILTDSVSLVIVVFCLVFSDKMVQLICGGSVINWAYPVKFNQ